MHLIRLKNLVSIILPLVEFHCSLDDLIVPEHKAAIVKKADKEVQRIEDLYMDGVITNGERYNKVLSIWEHATAEVASEMTKMLERQDQEAFHK